MLRKEKSGGSRGRHTPGDYYGERGCCLTCGRPDMMRGYTQNFVGDTGEVYPCMCYECKCRKCEWYDDWSRRCARPETGIIQP